MDDEIVKVETTEVSRGNPDSLIERAIDGKLDITIIRELVLMKMKWDAEEARKAFIRAMAEFQKECPVIVKSKKGGVTKAGDVAYVYAPIDVIVSKTKDLISKNGFSYTFDTPVTMDKGVEIAMTINHIAGHSKVNKTFMPFVIQNNLLSPPQVMSATTSYALRRCFCDGFGITTGDEDNDGQARGLLESQFMDLVKDWKSNTEIIAVADTIETMGVYRDFLSKLPAKPDVDRFIKCVEKIDRAKHQKIWTMFEKSCITMKWSEFIQNLEKQTNTNIEKATILTQNDTAQHTDQNIQKPSETKGSKECFSEAPYGDS